MGYWGWGNHAEQLVHLIDQSEKENGYAPPMFVDIRLKRSARANDFRDNNFANIVGDKRYKHLEKLDNANIGTKKRGIKIKDPSAVSELLEDGLRMKREKRRVIYFCACLEPICCHRHVVAQKLAKHARKRGIAAQSVEWPGGEPLIVDLNVSRKMITSVQHEKFALPLTTTQHHLRTLPWYSVVRFHCDGAEESIFTGPAIFKKTWCIPFYESPDSTSNAKLIRKAKQRRAEWGYARVK